MNTDFQDNLDKIAADSLYNVGVNSDTIEYSFEVFSRFIKGRNILELGPAEGLMTEKLHPLGLELTCVEGSRIFSEDLVRRFPDIQVVNCLFEEFEPGCKYDNIILGHVLEHVIDPVDILRRVRSWLSEEGIVLSAVPNAMSIHRQAAVLMGLIDDEKAMSELDIHHGHYRVFDPMEFRSVFLQSGLNIITHGGYWLKPLSNRQIERDWTPEMLMAFMRLGERYPDIAGEQYVIAKQ